MGNSATSQQHPNDEDAAHEWDQFDGIDTLGYRVLGVQPDSPASSAGLVSFFDFIVGANEQILMASGEGLEEGEEYDDVDFPALLQEFLNKPLELLVWNVKNQEKRLVTVVPSLDWGGAGLLGVTIRLDNYGGADERLIRVLEVQHQSPAAIAGLVPLQDYLLGTATESFSDTQVLATVLQQHVDQVVELYVYNTDSDVVRVVSLMPTLSWGGNGLLGAEVGTGYLHRLPEKARHTTGTSVERKVRWVGPASAVSGVPGQHPQAAANSSSDGCSSGGGDGGPPRQATKPSQAPPMLQVEPQLEMEVEDEGRPEDANKTIQQVADHSIAAGADKVGAVAPVQPNPSSLNHTVLGSSRSRAATTAGEASESSGMMATHEEPSEVTAGGSGAVHQMESSAPAAEPAKMTRIGAVPETHQVVEEPREPAGVSSREATSDEPAGVPSEEVVPVEPANVPPPPAQPPAAAAAPPPMASYMAPPPVHAAVAPPSADAAALFASPPPAAASNETAGGAAASPYMPPPPMSFLSSSRPSQQAEEVVDLR